MKRMVKNFLLAASALLLSFQVFCQSNPDSPGPLPLKVLPTGEFEINPDLCAGAAAYDQVSPVIAFNGTSYLAVWTDNRTTLDKDIYGLVLDLQGHSSSPAFIISDAPGDQYHPAVASNGDIFMVIWEDERNKPATGIDIYGARVTADGQVSESSSIKVCDEPDDQTLPALSSGEGNFLAVWVDYRSGTNKDIYANFISGNGNVTSSEGLAICTQGGWQNSPDLCFDGSRYLIVWADQRGFSKDIFGTFLKTDGTVSHTNGTGIVTIFNNQEYPSLARSETQFFLAWQETQAGAPPKIYGGRLNAAGVLQDAAGILIASDEMAPCLEPDVASISADFLITYSNGTGDFAEDYDIAAKRVSADGIIMDPDGLDVCSQPGAQNEPAVAFAGPKSMIAWTDMRATFADIYFTLIDGSGVVENPDGLRMTGATSEQLNVSLAFDGTNYLAVWCDTWCDGRNNIFATLIDDDGNILEPGVIEVATEAGLHNNPVAAFNGTHYLVVWEHDRKIVGKRISNTGVNLDNQEIIISQGELLREQPVVESDGTNWLVAWADYRNSVRTEYHRDIFGAIIDNDGAVIQPEGIPLIELYYDQVYPDIVYAGDHYVMIWEDYRSGEGSLPNIYAARISAEGAVIDNGGVGIALNGNLAMYRPRIAWDSTNFLACWHSGTEGDLNIDGIRINASLATVDPQPIAIAQNIRDQKNACVAFNGENYVVLWMNLNGLLKYRIDMARVMPDGTIAESGVLAEGDKHVIYPDIIHGPLKQVFTAYSAFSTEFVDGNVFHVMGQLIGEGQGPGINENAGIIRRFDIYPNPSHGEITVQYELAERSSVRFSLSTLDGRYIRQLSQYKYPEKKVTVSFNLQDLPEAGYILTLRAGSSVVSKKIQLLH
jgi:hypothetical protein